MVTGVARGYRYSKVVPCARCGPGGAVCAVPRAEAHFTRMCAAPTRYSPTASSAVMQAAVEVTTAPDALTMPITAVASGAVPRLYPLIINSVHRRKHEDGLVDTDSAGSVKVCPTHNIPRSIRDLIPVARSAP